MTPWSPDSPLLSQEKHSSFLRLQVPSLFSLPLGWILAFSEDQLVYIHVFIDSVIKHVSCPYRVSNRGKWTRVPTLPLWILHSTGGDWPSSHYLTRYKNHKQKYHEEKAWGAMKLYPRWTCLSVSIQNPSLRKWCWNPGQEQARRHLEREVWRVKREQSGGGMACAKTASLGQRFSTSVYISLRAFKSTDAWVLFSAFLMESIWAVAWASGPLESGWIYYPGKATHTAGSKFPNHVCLGHFSASGDNE